MLRLGRRFIDAWREIDSRRFPATPLERKAVLFLYATAVLLLVALWIGNRGFFGDHFGARVDPGLPLADMMGELWWGGWMFVCFGLVPAVLVKATGGSLRAHGLTLRGVRSHLLLYALLLVAVTPLVIFAATQPSFQETYPLCRAAGKDWTHFLVWEAVYLLQFISLEFFFRGFLLFGLVRYVGVLAIPLMVIPYALIHIGKPLPEALGAIIAGTILGVVALRTRSVVGGIFVHYGVALTMDVMALVRRGELFT